MSELKAPGKSFAISKQEVWEAWEKVKGPLPVQATASSIGGTRTTPDRNRMLMTKPC